jgi:hypothetical protein
LKVYQLSSKEVYVRGVVQDLVPKKLKEFSYSLNFSGWFNGLWMCLVGVLGMLSVFQNRQIPLRGI